MKIYRTEDPEIIQRATSGHHGDDFDPNVWIENPDNIALVNDRGDVNLFQYEQEGVYVGHFFYISRGKEALKAAKEMLDHIFQRPEVKILTGLTPVEKLGAKWLTRKLGFTSYGEVDTPPGRCELFILSRLEYEKDKAGWAF